MPLTIKVKSNSFYGKFYFNHKRVNPSRDDFRNVNWVDTIQVAVISKIEIQNWNVIKAVRMADLLIIFPSGFASLKTF